MTSELPDNLSALYADVLLHLLKNKKAENFIQDKNNPNYGYGIEIEPLVYNSRNNQLKSNECAGTDSLLDISLKSNGLKPEESFNHSIPL